MDISPITLVLGETYFVMDFYGMLGFDAVYCGIAEADYGNQILVFERIEKSNGCYPFAGVVPEFGFDLDRREKTKNTLIWLSLRASHYGQSVETLRHVNHREIPPFTLKTT